MKRKILIAPSILSANFAELKSDIKIVEKAGADWLHIDVMDGHFVPNLTIGPVVVKSLRPISKMFFDVHLMIDRPDLYVEPFHRSGADLITFHIESVKNPKDIIRHIKKKGLKAGISIKPKTPVSKILPLLKELDLVLVMTVEPGFGGQSFMPDMVKKIRQLRMIIDRKKFKCHLQVDGGINNKTAVTAVNAGADVLVAGNSIFGTSSPAHAVKTLRKAVS